jgi:hypothetical protein
MKTNSKISAYILRGSTIALLFSCVLIALSSAINLPEQPPKVRPPQDNAAFAANAHQDTASFPASARRNNRTLSFAERVAYQRAIEDVYWRHRIWPKERPDRKPSLDAMTSKAQLEKKVEDYLRNSQALEDYWQRPITAEQLQAEMDRMAKSTKQPEVLRELFEALGNDPFVIAECLGRPALADRLLRSWYAHDNRIHGQLKQRAEADLQTHPAVGEMKQFSGNYSEIELVKSATGKAEANSGTRRSVNSHEWDEIVRKLAAMFGEHPVRERVSRAKGASITQIKTGIVSSVQEDEERYYAMAVMERTEDHLKLVTISWPKKPLEVWLSKPENQLALAVPAADYKLPKISDGAECIDDTWTATGGAPLGRSGHTAIWTGSEMIIWGGANVSTLNTGGRYNPSTDTWIVTSTINAPDPRGSHTAVWTGTQMIVWGALATVSLRRLWTQAGDTVPAPTVGQPRAQPTHQKLGSITRQCWPAAK